MPSSATASVIIDTSVNAADIGDQIDVRLEFRHPAEWGVIDAPDPARVFADEFVVDLVPKSTNTDGDLEVTVWSLKLVAQRSGLWELPQAVATVELPSGGQARITSPSVVINVATPGGDSLEDLPPPELPSPSPLMRLQDAPEEELPFNWWIPLIAVAAFAGLGIVGWIVLRPKPQPPIPAEDIFLDELVGIPSLNDGKTMGAALSAALRRYVGAVYRFDGLGSTHRETEAQLREVLPAEALRSLGHLLRKVDDLRWTPKVPEETLLKPLIDGARDWVKGDAARRIQEAQEVDDASG